MLMIPARQRHLVLGSVHDNHCTWIAVSVVCVDFIRIVFRGHKKVLDDTMSVECFLKV